VAAAIVVAAALMAGCRSGVADPDRSPRSPHFQPAPGSPIAVGPMAGAVRVGDVNGDGRDDLVVTSGAVSGGEPDPGAGFVHVLAGDGRGGFRALVPPLAEGIGGLKADAGDFDGDGRCDVVVGAHDKAAVALWLQDERGRFRPERRASFETLGGTRPHTHSVVAADVTGDGRLDVLTTNADDDSVSILLGDGAGGLAPAPGSPFPAGRHPYEGLCVADLDGDGRLDVVVPNLHGRSVTALLGDGRGGFRFAPGSPIAAGDRPGFTALGDVDGDGLPDIVATHDDDPIVHVLRNEGGGRFRPAPGSPIVLDETVWGAAVADVDADGRADLVLGPRGGHLFVLFGGARGGFPAGPARVPVSGRAPGNVAVADVDRDGRPDLVTGNYESGNVSVLLQR